MFTKGLCYARGVPYTFTARRLRTTSQDTRNLRVGYAVTYQPDTRDARGQ
jgi:hypothetical protein